MWIDTSIVVGDQTISLAVERLEHDECERAAAAIAWFSHIALSDDTDAAPAEWRTFMETVIFEHVRFTIPEDQLRDLGRAWWSEASGRAIGEFVRVNSLVPALRRYLCAIERSGSTGSARGIR